MRYLVPFLLILTLALSACVIPLPPPAGQGPAREEGETPAGGAEAAPELEASREAPVNTNGGSTAQDRIAALREEWYAAYFGGDTATLEKIEADDFVVVGPSGVETTEGRYAAIQKRVQENRWFAPGTTRGAEQVEYRIYKDAVLVHGRGVQPEEGEQESTLFTEVWVRRDGDWQVAHLHFHSAQ